MSKKCILVAAHPRSGTHFTINSLCMNLKDIEFPLIRDGYPSLEGLFLTHDDEYIKEWEEASIIEHRKLIKLLSEKKFQEAAKFIRDIHWSFKVQEKYVRKYYSLESNRAI